MKIHRILLHDNMISEWLPMREWLDTDVGVSLYGLQFLNENEWMISFFYEEDKVKFILRWL